MRLFEKYMFGSVVDCMNVRVLIFIVALAVKYMTE